MTIEKHGNKWRVSEQINGKRFRVSVNHKPSTREATALIREKMADDRTVRCGKGSFLQYSDKYISAKSNILSPSTIRAYRSIIKNLSDDFCEMQLSAITQERIQVEINNYAATHSPKSTRNAHGFISAVLGLYRPQMHISTTLPQKVKFEPYTPSEEDVKKILNEVTGTKYEIAYRLGCYGMRRGEICAITAADLKGNMLTINKAMIYTDDGTWVIKPFPKTTESAREIYIDDYLADLIREQGRAYAEHPERLSKRLKIVCRHNNIPEFRFHDLRAYYATLAHSMGIPDKYIMANGGWSSNRIMDRVYKRTFAEKQADANRMMAERLGASVGHGLGQN